MHILTAGVDEAGRGPLVGSVFAAAVILPEIFDLPGLTDSKKLSEKKRDALAEMIKIRRLRGTSPPPGPKKSPASTSCTPPCSR